MIASTTTTCVCGEEWVIPVDTFQHHIIQYNMVNSRPIVCEGVCNGRYKSVLSNVINAHTQKTDQCKSRIKWGAVARKPPMEHMGIFIIKFAYDREACTNVQTCVRTSSGWLRNTIQREREWWMMVVRHHWQWLVRMARGMFLLLCLVAAVIDPINVICFLSIKLMNYEYYHSINMSISFSPGQFHPNRSSFRSFRASSVSRCSRCWWSAACGDAPRWLASVTAVATSICRTMQSAWSDLVLFIGSVSPVERNASHRTLRWLR